MQEEKKYRIGWGMVLILLIVSGICDAGSLVPFVGDFVAPIYFAAMTWYLWKTGHGLLNVKIIIPEAISAVAEFIPVVQALPTMIAATIAIIVISRFEDKTGLKVMPGKIPGTRLPKRVPPLNQGSVRLPRNQIVEELEPEEAA